MNLFSKSVISFAAFSSALSISAADDYSTTLNNVIAHNPSLVASFAALDAEKAENLTGLNLADPEVELSYQWGVPSDVPDKKTIDVSQEFDFATLSGAKKRLALLKNAGADAEFKAALRSVAAEADALMTDIVFRRRMALYYDSALNLMNRTLEAANMALEKGEITVVDMNSIRMDLSALRTDCTLNDIDCRAALSSLAALGGSANINWSSAEYSDYSLPADFNAWIQDNVANAPDVRIAAAAGKVADSELSLRKSENLPSFSLGYTSELVKDANYHGVTLGIQLPLWANSGRVKAARAAANAAQIASEKAALDFELKHRTLYDKALANYRLLEQTRALARECDIQPTIEKSFAEGIITAHEYFSQLVGVLELNKRVIEAEYAFRKSLADFRADTIR